MAIDLSKLSDEDLAAVQSGDMSKVSDEGLDIISGQSAAPKESPKAKLPVDDKDTSDALEKMAGKPDEDTEKIMGKEPSQKEMHAAMTGAVKGATFGFSPNIGAAGDVAADVIQGKQGLSGLGAKWRQYQQDRQTANKGEEEESPAAFTTGEVAGGLGTMLVPGLGELAGGGKLLEAAKDISPAAKTFLEASGKGSGLATKLAGKATAGAIESAPVGAAYGLGDSDKTIEGDPIGLAKDAASGAGMGSLAGAGINAIAQAGKSGINAISHIGDDNIDIQKGKQLFNVGYKQGVNVTSDSGRRISAIMSNETLPNDLTNTIMNADALTGQKMGNALQKMTDNGDKIQVSDDVYNATKNIFSKFIDNPTLQDLVDPKSKKVIDFIYKTGSNDLSPLEARELSKTLYNLGSNLDGMTGDIPTSTQRQAYKLAGNINDSIKAQSSDYANASDRFAEFRSMFPENIIEPNTPADKRTVFLGDLKNKQNKLFKASRDLLNGAQAPGAQTASGTLGSLGNNLQQLKITNPDAYNAMGGDSAFKNIQDKANLIAGMNQVKGVNPHEGFIRSIVGTVTGSGEAPALNIVNKLGRAAAVTGQSAPVQLGTKLYSSTNDQLANLAKTMQGDPATKYLGETLEKALSQKTNVLKNAVLFRMLQDPTYRGLLKQVGYEPEGNNK